jgi:hypothetical protein
VTRNSDQSNTNEQSDSIGDITTGRVVVINTGHVHAGGRGILARSDNSIDIFNSGKVRSYAEVDPGFDEMAHGIAILIQGNAGEATITNDGVLCGRPQVGAAFTAAPGSDFIIVGSKGPKNFALVDAGVSVFTAAGWGAGSAMTAASVTAMTSTEWLAVSPITS